MFSPRLLLPRSLPRTSLLSRTLSTLPPPPPPPAAARSSRLRSFALTSASLVIAGYAMVASQNQATLMLEEAQGITRERLPTQTSYPAQPPTTNSSKTSSSIGGNPEFESTSVQSSFASSQPKEMTQEDIDDLDSGLDGASEEGGASSSSSSGANSAAYNEETGEINWDCPCLGGMAHGPCGEQFRASFTCFIKSEEEPKGIECVESFKAMQGCFRDHPEIYGGDDFEDDEEEGAADDAFEKAHPPPADLESYGEGSGEDADLVAQAERALMKEKLEEGLQEAKEGGEPLFEEKIGSKTQTDSQI